MSLELPGAQPRTGAWYISDLARGQRGRINRQAGGGREQPPAPAPDLAFIQIGSTAELGDFLWGGVGVAWPVLSCWGSLWDENCLRDHGPSTGATLT